jgi:hypothetical protein
MLRVAGLLVLAVVLAAGTMSWQERTRVGRMTESVAARRELAAARLAPEGTAPQAGISARTPIRVQPLPDRLARRLRNDPDFQRLSHRCGVCHATPDPALHGADEWPVVVSRMAGTIDAAGLLPLHDADRQAVLRVLREYAASLRATPPAPPAPAPR